MAKENTVSQFLKEHLWSIIVGLLAAAGTFIWLQAEVVGMERRVNAMEIKQAEYPSKDWFNLKFSIIEEKIDDNTIRLKDL